MDYISRTLILIVQELAAGFLYVRREAPNAPGALDFSFIKVRLRGIKRNFDSPTVAQSPLSDCPAPCPLGVAILSYSAVASFKRHEKIVLFVAFNDV